MYLKLLFCLSLFSFSAISSDHIDGSVSSEHPHADISDLYAFKSPNKEDTLTLVMNIHPLAERGTHFQEKIKYVFQIREASIIDGAVKTNKVSSQRIVCSFKISHHHNDNSNDRVTCSNEEDFLVSGEVNTIIDKGSTKLFAGQRSDPFFLNLQWLTKSMAQGFLEPKVKVKKFLGIEGFLNNTISYTNTLSIVLEVKISTLFPESNTSLFATSVELYTEDNKVLDRIGRPEITNIALRSSGDNDDLRNGYNAQPTFKISPEKIASYTERLASNIEYYDGFDDKADWSASDKLKLANLLATDVLLVDTSKECAEDTFLSIEKSIMKDEMYTNCGGRFFEDDIIDDFLSYLINKGNQKLGDGVDKPRGTMKEDFPYLQNPQLGPIGKFKTNRIKKALASQKK